MINTTDWATQKTNVLTTNQNGIAFQKGEVVSILTNIGAPPQNFTYTALKSPWPQGTVTIECVCPHTTVYVNQPAYSVVGCRQFVVASGGYLEVEYTKGGVPVVLAKPSSLNGSGLCGSTMEALHANTLPGQTVAQSSALHRAVVPSLIALLLMAASLGLW
jgi:alpha-amylase